MAPTRVPREPAGPPGLPPPERRLVVVMGVSGVGKTAVGRALAARLEVPYADADDLHPAANVAKMTAGVPLTDDDRAPWLASVGTWLREHAATGGVMSCSALHRSYRDVLVGAAPSTRFLHLTADPEVLRERMTSRRHFMPAALLTSQLQTLEPLADDEPGTTVESGQPVDAVVSEFLAQDLG
jgi:gluconokinase